MTTTPNLELTYMAANQNDKEVVYNDSLDKLDKQLAGLLIINTDTDANITLTSVQNEYLVLKITDTGSALTTARDIIVPTINRLHVAWNNTGGGYALTFKTAAGSGISVGDGEKKLIYCDGINVEQLAGLQTGEYPLDIQLFSKGVGIGADIIYYMPLTRTTIFPIDLANSYAEAAIAANASTVYSVKKNGTEFATVTFAASATSATFIASTATSFSPGDILEIHTPATADTNLADIGFNFKVSDIA